MDEHEYHQAYRTTNPLPCPFERAVLVRCCACEKAQRLFIAEREGVACRQAAAREVCNQVHELLKEKSRFALGLAHVPGELPYGKAMRVICGGLTGLQEALHPQRLVVGNVYELLRGLLAHYGSWEQLPWNEIVRAVGAFQLRRRRSPQH